MDQTLHRVATKEKEDIKSMTKQKMVKRQNREGGNDLDQESNRQTTMEDIDGGLHPAVDGQSLDERRPSMYQCLICHLLPGCTSVLKFRITFTLTKCSVCRQKWVNGSAFATSPGDQGSLPARVRTVKKGSESNG